TAERSVAELAAWRRRQHAPHRPHLVEAGIVASEHPPPHFLDWLLGHRFWTLPSVCRLYVRALFRFLAGASGSLVGRDRPRFESGVGSKVLLRGYFLATQSSAARRGRWRLARRGVQWYPATYDGTPHILPGAGWQPPLAGALASSRRSSTKGVES